MSIKNKNLRVRLNLQINEDVKQKSDVLREKHHLNISSLCRDAIEKKYQELENENKPVK